METPAPETPRFTMPALDGATVVPRPLNLPEVNPSAENPDIIRATRYNCRPCPRAPPVRRNAAAAAAASLAAALAVPCFSSCYVRPSKSLPLRCGNLEGLVSRTALGVSSGGFLVVGLQISAWRRARTFLCTHGGVGWLKLLCSCRFLVAVVGLVVDRG